MADHLRVLSKRDAGGEHGNVSTPAPPQLQNGNTTPAPSSASSTVYIVVGVVVPLVMIGIGVFLFYVWYRRKYPVRMVIGKDFERFSNPAYNKRTSTLTLVREDAEHYWDTFQPSGIQNPGLSLVDEEDQDAVQNVVSRRVEAIDETDAAVKMENIERMIEDGNIETMEQQSNITEASEKIETDDFEIIQTENDSDQNIKTGKPRKAMLIEDQNFEDFDAGFEIVSEVDLEQPTESEKSSLNDSTGTHTIALSIAGTTDGSTNSESLSQESAADNIKERSDAENLVQQHENNVSDSASVNDAGESAADNIKERSDAENLVQQHENNVSDSASVNDAGESPADNIKEHSDAENLVKQHENNVSDSASVNDAGENLEKELPGNNGDIDETNESKELPVIDDQLADHSTNTKDNTNEEQNLNVNIKENDINLKVNIADQAVPNTSFEAPNSVESIENQTGIKSFIPEANEGQTIQDSNSENSLENIDFEASNVKERPTLTLSTEKIYLENVPPTPTVVIQDSIIFESESVSPVHLDDVQEPPVRQHRAHTIECISENLKKTEETGNAVTKDWFSFGDIDKMSISKDSIELFEPIVKVILDSSKDNDEEVCEIEIKQPVPTELITETVEHSELPSEAYTDLFQISDNQPVTLPSNASKPEQSDTTLSSLGSFSFDVINDSNDNSENSEDSMADRQESEDTEETDKLHNPQNGSHSFESAHSDVFSIVSNDVLSNELVEGEQKDLISPDINFTASSSLLLREDSVTQEPSSALLSDDNSAQESTYSVISNQSIELIEGDTKTGDLFNMPSENHTDTSMLASMDDSHVNKENGETDLLGPNMIKSETQERADVSDIKTSLLDFSSDNQTTKNVSTGENAGLLLNFVNETGSLNTVSMNSSLPMSKENQTNELDLFLTGSGQKVTNDVSNEENTFEESFQQFQTSFLNASTPTASLVTDPLVAFGDGNELLNETFSKDAQTTPSNTEDSFGFFDRANVSQGGETSNTEASLSRMLSTESSSIHSWELVSEDGEKNISGSMEAEDSPTVATASIVTLDEENHESDKEDELPGLINILTDEVRNKTKITPTGIKFDFSDINDNNDDDDTDDSDSNGDDDDNDIRPSNDSNHSLTGDGNISWEVLDDDTEA